MIKIIKNLWKIRKIVLNTILSFLLILLFIHIINLLSYKYISIEFKDLRPMREKIDIFYKGIKIGYVRKMTICHNSNSTLVHCVLTYKGLLLPNNSTALMKKEKKKNKEYDFIELQYPQKPSTTMIGNGTLLDGKTTVDIIHFMSNQNPDELEEIKNNLAESTKELEIVISALADLLSTTESILKENQKNIYSSTYNFSQTTKKIQQLSSKIDNAITQEDLNNSISNLTQTSTTIKDITQDFTGTTTNINEAMIPQIQSTLYKTECLIANSNEIVCGIKQTLQKRFGTFHLLFGKPISSKNVNNKRKNCNKN